MNWNWYSIRNSVNCKYVMYRVIDIHWLRINCVYNNIIPSKINLKKIMHEICSVHIHLIDDVLSFCFFFNNFRLSFDWLSGCFFFFVFSFFLAEYADGKLQAKQIRVLHSLFARTNWLKWLQMRFRCFDRCIRIYIKSKILRRRHKNIASDVFAL